MMTCIRNNIVVSIANPSDITGINLKRESVSLDSSNSHNLKKLKRNDIIQETYQVPLVAKRDILICGYLSCEGHDSDWIMQIFIDNKYKRMGIGTKLINYLKTLLNNTNKAKRIQLWVLKENIPAIQFYKEQGFKFIKNDGSNGEFWSMNLCSK